MRNLKSIVENTDTKAGKAFDLFIQSLIVLSLVTFSIETLPNLPSSLYEVLSVIELFTVTVFTFEYLLRIFVADHKMRFIFSFHGIIDFLAIFPFYLRLGVDLRSIRIFRLFRLFRVLKLFRYSKAILRFKKAFIIIKSELALFFLATMFLIYLSSVGIYYFENTAQPENFASVFHSLWWSVATLTTVGYGDIYPITTGGKVFTFIILMIGLSIVAVPAGLFSSALKEILEEEEP